VDVVAGSVDEKIYAFTHSGNPVGYFPIATGADITSSPGVADLDRDGDLEIVIGSNAGIQAIDVKTPAGSTSYWSVYRGNPTRSGYYADIFVGVGGRPLEEPRASSGRPVLRQNYPNPVQAGTIIQYAIPRQTMVRVVIYNAIGQEVTTLVQGKQKPGSHQVGWDAGSVATGVYFCRLEAEGTSQIKKIVVLR
jgi:hypothetical protein